MGHTWGTLSNRLYFMQIKITKTSLKEFSETAKKGERLNDSLQPGFHARKLASGISLNFRFISQFNIRRTIKLGDYPSLAIDEARKLVSAYAGRIAAGEDIAETLASKKDEKANTGISYITEIYDSELNKKADGKNIKADLYNHFGDLLKKPLTSLTPRMMMNWQKKKEAQDLSPKTIKKVYAYFNAMLNHAVKYGGVIEVNPIDKFTLSLRKATPEEEKILRQKRTYLTQQQTQQFFLALDLYQEEKRKKNANSRAHGKAYLKDLSEVEYVDYVKPIMLFLYFTGLRPGDALTLQWDELNLNFKRLTKVINKTRHKNEHPTTIPLSDKVIKILKGWHIQNGSPQYGYVFPNPSTGKPYGRLYKPWEKIKALASLPVELENYTLRHNFISHLVMNGANLLSVAKLATTSVEMIERHYGHLQPDLQTNYINQFANQADSICSTVPKKSTIKL